MVDRWDALFERLGGHGAGRAAAASKFGVSVSTLWRWRTGQVVPARIVRDVVNAYCDELGVERVFEEVRRAVP